MVFSEHFYCLLMNEGEQKAPTGLPFALVEAVFCLGGQNTQQDCSPEP